MSARFSRRRFLLNSAAAGLLALTPTAFAAPFSGKSDKTKENRMKIICLEEHVLDPALGKASLPAALKNAPYLPDWGKTVKDGNLPDRSRPQIERNEFINPKGLDMGEGRLKDMDAAGIDMQVLSYGGFPQFALTEESVALHRAANDRMAAAVAAHPDRFAGFATLPWQNPKAAADELERAVKKLGLKGALLNGRPSEHFIDHPDYDVLLAKFNELKVPFFLHPGVPVQNVQQTYYSGFSPEVDARLSMFGLGWHYEAGVHLLRLMLSGAFDRYPNLQVISGHWGEMLPFYLQRLDDSIPQAATGLKRSLIQTVRDQVYLTPSGMLTLPHFQFVYDLVGAERIVFSVDYPYQTLDGVRAFIENLPIPQAHKAMIAHGNAEKLLQLA